MNADDDEFGIDAFGIHATNEERMEIVVMRMPPDQREIYRRMVFDSGILPNDNRWQFIEMITRYGPEAAHAMMREIGRINYKMSEPEIDAWQERVSAKVEKTRELVILDMGFENAISQQNQQTLATDSQMEVGVVRRIVARLRCFIRSTGK